MAEFEHIFRLGRRAGDGVVCDEDGLSVGDVALLERAPDLGGRAWRPRPVDDIDRDLSLCYGLPVGIEPRMGGLEAVARALGRGDLAHAQIVALHLRLPDPPDLAKSAEGFGELALRLDESGLLKGDWDPSKHPRWPTGSPDSQGGQFAPGYIDLHEEERLGGHAIERHVGKNETYLNQRIKNTSFNNYIYGGGEKRAGSFSSLEAAQKLTSATLARSAAVVAKVARGEKSDAVVGASFTTPTGMEAYKAEGKLMTIMRKVYNVQVVIEHAPDVKKGFVVVTSFPTGNVFAAPGITQ